MLRFVNTLWGRMSFLFRLLLITTFSLILAAGIMLFQFIHQEVYEMHTDLQNELTQELEVMPELLAEIIVVGDFASLQHQLDNYVNRPHVANIKFIDPSGKILQSKEKKYEEIIAPSWFLKGFGFYDYSGNKKVIVGNTNYGTIAITLSAGKLVNQAWLKLVDHLGVLLLAIFLDFIGIWLMLRYGLTSLTSLENFADSIANGTLETPLKIEGSSEIKHLIIAFNHMQECLHISRSNLQAQTNTILYERNRLEIILNTLSEGVCTLDTNQKVLHVNTTTCKILGYSEDELIGQNAHELYHAHTHDRTIMSIEECPIMKAFQEGDSFMSTDEYFTCKDKKLIPVEIFAHSILHEGKNLGMVIAFRDISLRKANEKCMKLLATALEATSNAVVITNKEAIIEWANSGFEHMTGYSVGEALGNNPHALISSGKQEKKFYTKMWDTILAKKPWFGEVINKRKNGELYYEELNITPVMNENGEIVHFVAIKKDISERKKIEKEMVNFAFHDPLTGLPNRRLLMERLERVFITVQRYNLFGAVLFLDLDYFKDINDELGHDVGDLLLKEIAIRLVNAVRQEDTVARIGGDEFVIILKNLNGTRETASTRMKNLAQKIQNTFKTPFLLNRENYAMTISLGGTLFDGKDFTTEEVLKQADNALYRAKETGRNKSCFEDD